MLDHHEVLRADKFHPVSDMQIESYLDRNDYVNAQTIDTHIERFIDSSDAVTHESLNESINEWMSNNFDLKDYDIEDTITDAVRSINFTVEVS